MSKRKKRHRKSDELLELADDLEASGTGEMASFYIACEMLEIDPDDGFAMLAEDNTND